MIISSKHYFNYNFFWKFNFVKKYIFVCNLENILFVLSTAFFGSSTQIIVKRSLALSLLKKPSSKKKSCATVSDCSQ